NRSLVRLRHHLMVLPRLRIRVVAPAILDQLPKRCRQQIKFARIAHQQSHGNQVSSLRTADPRSFISSVLNERADDSCPLNSPFGPFSIGMTTSVPPSSTSMVTQEASRT